MIVRSLLRQFRHADPTFGVNQARIPSNGEGWTSWAGVSVTEMQALQQLTVWSCVALTTDVIATMPVGTFRGVGPDRIPIANAPFLEEPFPNMDRVEWLTMELVSILLRGNAYARVIERDRLMYPTQLLPMHPDEVQPRLNKLTGQLEYKVAGEAKPLDPVDVFHVKGLTLPGKRMIKGLDPIAYARQTIGTALAAEEYGARFFGESATPSGYLSSDKPIGDDTAKDMQARWMAAHGNRHRKPAVLGGGLKWETITINPEESQFLATIKAKRGEIAGFFRTPPHLVGDVDRSTSWGSGIEEQNLMWITIGLGTWIVRFERAFTRITPRGQYVKFNLAGLLRGRLLDRYRAYLMGRQGGWLNIDEIRALEELPPLPEGRGQDYLMPLNYAPIPPQNAADAQVPEPSAPPAVTEPAP